jgi:hypothetical protein
MNSAGHINYCPVCREAAILKIYSYVNPIDHFDPPNTQEVIVSANSGKYGQFLSVTPMKPRSKSLEVAWFVETLPADAPMPEPEVRTTGATGRDAFREAIFGRSGGDRERDLARAAEMVKPPVGVRNALGTTRKGKNGTVEHVLPIASLKPGVYRVTAAVADRTPFVLLDPKRLLEERKTWFVKVAAPAAAAK